MAKLLVSVRSAAEARAAAAGGAAIVDVKEPLRGPLGRAAADVAREVRAAVGERVPLSIALGELDEWFGPAAPDLTPWATAGSTWVKLGLSQAKPGWRDQWRTLRDRLSTICSTIGLPSPAWIAVVYADWEEACAPHPSEVLGEALEAGTCQGVLIDTWDKSGPSLLEASWKELIDRVRHRRSIALAGKLDVEAIDRLASLQPDIIAVRSAACVAGNRLGKVDAKRVARLVEAAARVGDLECASDPNAPIERGRSASAL